MKLLYGKTYTLYICIQDNQREDVLPKYIVLAYVKSYFQSVIG